MFQELYKPTKAMSGQEDILDGLEVNLKSQLCKTLATAF